MMATEVYVFALWRRERQWRYVDRLLVRRERAEAMRPLSTVEAPPVPTPAPAAAWSPGLGASCWLLDVANDPASGGRACTVVLRDDVSGAVLEVAASDPRICRGEVAS